MDRPVRHCSSTPEKISVSGDSLSSSSKRNSADSCVEYERQGRELADPLDRLRSYITASVAVTEDVEGARFFSAEYLRLRQLFPEEMTRTRRRLEAICARSCRTCESL